MPNTDILKRKGFSEEEISKLEQVCLGTESILYDEFSLSDHRTKVADELDANAKLKRRMHAISPAEGRYDRYAEKLHGIVSEFAWVKKRVMIEVEYLIALTDELHGNYRGEKRPLTSRKFTEQERDRLRGLYRNFNEDDFRRIQLLDRHIQHDIVAMTTWIVYELGDSMGDLKESVETALHFALTSNDINQNVYNMTVKEIMKECFIPTVVELQETILDKVSSEDDVVFAGQTHGQYAEYTTLRKVFANWADAVSQTLVNYLSEEGPVNLPGKLGGAVGNNSDLLAAYPDLYDYLQFNFLHKEFIKKILGLEYTKMCDQPEFGVKNQELYDSIVRTNNVLIKVCQDFWDYCSRGLFRKKTKPGESGSSVMAQKANPWLSEGAEEAFTQANAGFRGFERMLKYRMQGDLRRSLLMRSIGEHFARTLVAMKRLTQELNKYDPNYVAIAREVEEHPEMSAAAVQTILRREGIPEAYDLIKEITMGKPIKVGHYQKLADQLQKSATITQRVKKEIIFLVTHPEENTGYAKLYADEAISNARDVCGCLKEAYGINKEVS